MKKFRFGLIGAGAIGNYHLNAIAESLVAEVAAVTDSSLVRAEARANPFGAAAFTDYKRMVLEIRPDAVVIALPHFLHREVAVWCVEHGCHLLVEKPMAITPQECKDIEEAALRNRVVVLVGQTQQYIGYNRIAKELMGSHDLGKLLMIHDLRHGPCFGEQRQSWFLDRSKAGGGIVMNLGAHSIDKIQWFTDSKIAKVRASLSYEHPDYPEIEGSAVLYMETNEGIPCTVHLSGYEAVNKEETEFVFTKGMIRIVNHDSVWLSDKHVYRKVNIDALPNPFRLQVEDLCACIENGRQPYASAKYGRSVVQVIDTVYRSHRTGQIEMVTVNEFKEKLREHGHHDNLSNNWRSV